MSKQQNSVPSAKSRSQVIKRKQKGESYTKNKVRSKRSADYDEWKTKSLRRLSQGGAVAARVASYERRLTAESPTELMSPTSGGGFESENRPKRKPSVSVKYGLVQRPELFIANPDHHRAQSSGDSSL